MLRGIIHLALFRKPSCTLQAEPREECTSFADEKLKQYIDFWNRSSYGKFHRNEDYPLCKFHIDEFSMVDTLLAAALIKAVPTKARVLFIGDKDQLPSVGPGNILRELLSCPDIPAIFLTHVFRQSGGSDIAEKASRINQGYMPNPIDGTHFHFHLFDTPEEGKELLKKIITEDLPGKLSIDPLQNLQVLSPRKGPLGILNSIVSYKNINPTYWTSYLVSIGKMAIVSCS